MENFFMVLGFGFLLLCFAVVLTIIGIFGYFIYIKIEKNKKLEVSSGKETSSQNNSKWVTCLLTVADLSATLIFTHFIYNIL